MYRIIIIAVIGVFGFTACGSDTVENTNTNEGPGVENTNIETQNVNEAPKLEEEVPEYDDAETALKKGVEYLDGNMLENAINALKQAVELDEDLADAHFQLGVALSLKESEEDKIVPGQLVDDTEEAPEKTPKEKKKDSEVAFENAVKAYKKIVAKDNKNHAAYFNLGRAYGKLFDDKEARKALERAVKLNDEDTTYRTELGAVLIKLAQYPLAIRQLKKALELDDANYRAEDLLEKATAGKKRVGHSATPKPKASSSSSSSSSSSKKSTKESDSEDEKPDSPAPAKPKKAKTPSPPVKKKN